MAAPSRSPPATKRAQSIGLESSAGYRVDPVLPLNEGTQRKSHLRRRESSDATSHLLQKRISLWSRRAHYPNRPKMEAVCITTSSPLSVPLLSRTRRLGASRMPTPSTWSWGTPFVYHRRDGHSMSLRHRKSTILELFTLKKEGLQVRVTVHHITDLLHMYVCSPYSSIHSMAELQHLSFFVKKCCPIAPPPLFSARYVCYRETIATACFC